MRRTLGRLFAATLLFASAVPATAAEWAVAIGDGGDPIVARDFPSAYDAKNAALIDCHKTYSGCEIIARGSGGCLALATRDRGAAWGIGKATGLKAAQSKALEDCDGACEIVHKFCD